MLGPTGPALNGTLSRLNDAKPKAPGPFLQFVNKLLHTDPISFLFYGLYWSFILIVASPVAGCAQLIITALQLARYIFLFPLGMTVSKVNPREPGCQLAVVITGCDSGFGCDLAFELSRRGFFVFAGCLSNDSMEQFDGVTSVVPLKMDVTSDDEVSRAVAVVRDWINDTDANSRRFLHGLVNNAGVGTGGLIDWLDLSAYRRDMEVNYFGTIRATMGFLQLFKSQAYSGSHRHARIVNMVSMAGLSASGIMSPYHGSKFATEAFSTALRYEMKVFGVSVVTVNPSFHQTPITDGMLQNIANIWNGLSSEVRAEYGEDFFAQFCRNGVHLPASVMWKADVVISELVSSVENTNPPVQMAIGSDAKYALLLQRHFPVWLQDFMMSLAYSSKVKPVLMTRPTTS